MTTEGNSKEAPPKPKQKRVNLRTPDIMEAVQAQVEGHYRSELVDTLRARGNKLQAGSIRIRLAKEFGFCYGVERAIDLTKVLTLQIFSGWLLSNVKFSIQFRKYVMRD